LTWHSRCGNSSVLGQTRPNVPEVFEAGGRLYISRSGQNFTGIGHWRVDQPANKAVEDFAFDGPNAVDLYFLERYDLHLDFELNRKPRQCNATSVTGNMPSVWGWISMATYQGKIFINNRLYDVWSYTAGGVTLTIAVDPSSPNTPRYFERKTSTEDVAVHFDSFETNKPHDSWFNIPSICQS